jgi:hypothetical protein
MQFFYVAAFLIGTASLCVFMHASFQAGALAAAINAADVSAGGNGVPAAFPKSYPVCRARGSRAG